MRRTAGRISGGEEGVEEILRALGHGTEIARRTTMRTAATASRAAAALAQSRHRHSMSAQLRSAAAWFVSQPSLSPAILVSFLFVIAGLAPAIHC
jgi:hypothetical protein